MFFSCGDIEKVIKMLERFEVDYIILDKTVKHFDVKNYKWNKDIKLRDYQEEVNTKAINAKFGGSLIVPAGGGKTITAMSVIRDVDAKTLWITHTKDLMYQSADACEHCLGFYPGIVGDGKQDIKDVTIATVQTLSRRQHLMDKLSEEIELVIIDEAHHVPTSYFSKVIQQLKPRRMYGLTATPLRKDKMERFMYSVIGPKLVEIDRGLLYDKNKLIIPKLIPIYTEFEGDTIGLDEVAADIGGDNTNYHELVKKLTSCEKRQNLLVDNISKLSKGKKNLCLVEWVEYGNILIAKLKIALPKSNIEFIYGGTKKDERKRMLSDFKAGKIDILFATKLAREGLDLPNLEQLFLITPKKEDDAAGVANGAALEQEVGRVMRPDPKNPKKTAKVFDFVDYKNGILKNQWYTRRRTYKRLGISVPNKGPSKELHVDTILKNMFK